jgi:hypothetical protein
VFDPNDVENAGWEEWAILVAVLVLVWAITEVVDRIRYGTWNKDYRW